jgi:hypothetical protein
MATTFAAIATKTLTSAATDILFTSIPQNFKHLWITGMTAGSSGAGFRMDVNGSNGAAYNYAELYAASTSAPVQYGGYNNSASLGNAYSAGSTSWGGIDICIPNYSNTSNWKLWLYKINFQRYDSVAQQEGVYGTAGDEYNAAITSLNFHFTSGQMVAGTKITLYGLS